MIAATAEINIQPKTAAESRDTLPLHHITLVLDVATRWDHSGYSYYLRIFLKMGHLKHTGTQVD